MLSHGTRQQIDAEDLSLHKALLGYFSVVRPCSTDMPDERRAILLALTDIELDRIVARKRLNEDAIITRIATQLGVPVESVADAVFRLRFFWSEGCRAIPRKRSPKTALCSLCRERVELDGDGCCVHCRSPL